MGVKRFSLGTAARLQDLPCHPSVEMGRFLGVLRYSESFGIKHLLVPDIDVERVLFPNITRLLILDIDIKGFGLVRLFLIGARGVLEKW